MKKTVVYSELAPRAIGPYSQGISVNGFLFISGQLPVDPSTGGIPCGIGAQTEQSLSNMQAILAGAGLDLGDVVKTTVYLKDMNEFADMNTIYASFFGQDSPARVCVEVARLPKDVQVEIEAIACKTGP